MYSSFLYLRYIYLWGKGLTFIECDTRTRPKRKYNNNKKYTYIQLLYKVFICLYIVNFTMFL